MDGRFDIHSRQPYCVPCLASLCVSLGSWPLTLARLTPFPSLCSSWSSLHFYDGREIATANQVLCCTNVMLHLARARAKGFSAPRRMCPCQPALFLLVLLTILFYTVAVLYDAILHSTTLHVTTTILECTA